MKLVDGLLGDISNVVFADLINIGNNNMRRIELELTNEVDLREKEFCI